ncbi:MAG: transposase, partial [Sphaerotilus natans subsp. sulfidivorans]|uniref:zinc ribbon domain-containing protein n=1 Tax=Sphaerotilus sulfidivorans TaxID=639200 RepID=UPI0023528481
NRPTQARFECEACGHSENADLNAAKNIRAAGHAVWVARPEACGAEVKRAGPVRGRRAAAMKQEPAEGSAAQAVVPAGILVLQGGEDVKSADARRRCRRPGSRS